MRLSDFLYDLPERLIAQAPLPRAEDARLMLLPRADEGALGHRHIRDLPDLVRGDELLVFNDTRVVPARLHGHKDSGGAVELLVVGLGAEGDLEAMGRSSKPLRPGAHVTLRTGASLRVLQALGHGRYRVAPPPDGPQGWDFLAAHGEIPLPPYIRRDEGPRPEDHARYQTVFARAHGAVAAPTAGLHFTPALLERLAARGCETAFVTLHVGPGTFQPVRADDLREHVMHAERYEIPAATAEAIAAARAAGRPVLAVGTTVVRTLEASAARHGAPVPERAETDLFLTPGSTFRVVDQLLTNFHLPGSTLLMLVSAFAGHARTLAAYAEAVRREYRFFSYGDGMLIR